MPIRPFRARSDRAGHDCISRIVRVHNPLVTPPDWTAMCSGVGIQDDGSCYPFNPAPAANPGQPGAPLPTPTAAPTPTSAVALAPYCRPGENAAYQSVFWALSERLGERMGQPRSCEYSDPRGSDDTLQDTETGLAFYRRASNTPTFTNGGDHWALAAAGLLHWIGESIDPPADAELVQQ